MSQKRVSLHLTKPDTSLLLSTLYRLVGQHIIRARCSCLTFISHHMSKPLIVNNSNENVYLHLLSKYTTVHSFIPIVIVSMLQKFPSEMLHHIIILVFFKGMDILVFPIQGPILTSQTFHQHPHCHSRGEGMRVNNDVWSDSCLCERHIFLGPED